MQRGAHESTVFAFDDLAVAVESTDPSHEAWLREFLEPDFHVVDHAPAACRVRVVEDDARFDALASAVSVDAPLLDCFALDSSVVRLPIVARDGNATTVVDDLFGAAYAIEPDRRLVTIFTRRGHTRVRASLLRVVREFAMNAAHATGLFLHAASLASGDRGLVIAGAKAAGKTTLLAYLLSRGVGDYHSNDRVLATADGDATVLRNMPTVISVRPRTLELVPMMAERLAGSGFASYLLTLDEAAVGPERPFYRNHLGNFVFSPAQYRRLVGANPHPVCHAAALAFPVLTDALDTFELVAIDGRDALARLPDAFLGAGAWRKGTDAFTVPAMDPAPPEAVLLERAAHFVDGVRAVECRLGPGAFRDGALAEAFRGLLRAD